MGLTIISETVSEMCKVAHSFSDGEKEFVVQFAFKSGDKTLTNQLIDELSQCEDGQEFLIKLKLSYTLQGRIRVKRRVYELTEENRLYYEHCVDAAALWSRYVMPACAM